MKRVETPDGSKLIYLKGRRGSGGLTRFLETGGE